MTAVDTYLRQRFGVLLLTAADRFAERVVQTAEAPDRAERYG